MQTVDSNYCCLWVNNYICLLRCLDAEDGHVGSFILIPTVSCTLGTW
jgi:hypothetical protein